MGGAEPAHRAREGERLSGTRFATYAAEQAQAWGSAPWERLAGANAESHDLLLARLAPRHGDRWLDVGTGTGRLALAAARAGADVTGLDLAPELVATARRLAAEEGAAVRLDVGDAERLPYVDGAFDVVSSAFGAMFALDERAVARELARVLRPGGRLGLMTLHPDSAGAGMWRLLWRFDPRPDGAADPLAWGDEGHLHELLGEAFDLSTEQVEVSPHPERDPDEVWELYSSSFGPARALLDRVDAGTAAAFRAAYLEHIGQRLPRTDVLVVGIRR